MIYWHWLYRDFISAYSSCLSDDTWPHTYQQQYWHRNRYQLELLHFSPKGFSGESAVKKRVSELGREHFAALVSQILVDNEYESKIVSKTDRILNQLNFHPLDQHVYVIVGLDCTTIYSVPFEGQDVTVICLESVRGEISQIEFLLAHECHHWLRQSYFTHNVLASWLGERIVTEGMAAAFTQELIPGRSTAQYCFVNQDVVAWVDSHWEELDDLISSQAETADLMAALFSRNSCSTIFSGMPARTGYVYGYYKVRNCCRNLAISPVQLAAADWASVLYPQIG